MVFRANLTRELRSWAPRSHLLGPVTSTGNTSGDGRIGTKIQLTDVIRRIQLDGSGVDTDHKEDIVKDIRLDLVDQDGSVLRTLLETLAETHHPVETLVIYSSFVDSMYASQLAAILTKPKQWATLKCLRLFRCSPDGFPMLMDGFTPDRGWEPLAELQVVVYRQLTERQLTERRQTTDDDMEATKPTTDQIAAFLSAIETTTSLRVVKLEGIDLSGVGELLAELARCTAQVEELSLRDCHLEDVKALVCAIRDKGTLRRLGLPKNKIHNVKDLEPLFLAPSLTLINLSMNHLVGSRGLGVGDDYRQVLEALRQNHDLTELYIEMNPLSLDFAVGILHALEDNTTLQQLGLLTLSLPMKLTDHIRHLVNCNRQGRGFLRQWSTRRPELVPFILARVSQEPDLLMSFLCDGFSLCRLLEDTSGRSTF